MPRKGLESVSKSGEASNFEFPPFAFGLQSGLLSLPSLPSSPGSNVQNLGGPFLRRFIYRAAHWRSGENGPFLIASFQKPGPTTLESQREHPAPEYDSDML
ncbi:hypothetical protein HWI79_1194 [Cryptosporidium felis]|nr:hypothetical protein HWI79_1194 [Cryptosporidium felis]